MRYKDKEWLAEQYEEHTQAEIAEMCDVTHGTITYWMDKFDLETRGPGVSQVEGKHKDKDWLHKKYVEEQHSTNDIAEECGVGKTTVLYWLDKHDIDRRDHKEAVNLSWKNADERRKAVGERFKELHRTIHPFIFTKKNGYVLAGSSDGNGGSEFVALHRLTAVAEYGFDALEDMVVHHKNEVKWDNRPENLELMTQEDHSRHHAIKNNAKPPEWWKNE